MKIEGSIYAQSDKLKTKLEDKMKRFELQVQQKQDVLENELKQDMEDIEQQHDAGFKRVKDSFLSVSAQFLVHRFRWTECLNSKCSKVPILSIML